MIPVADRDLVALLQQDILWRSHGDDERLHTQHLDHMPAEHRANVLGWLRANAEMLQDLHAGHLTVQWRGGFITGEQWSRDIRYLAALDPAVWLEEQPLVRRLVQLVPREPLPARGRARADPAVEAMTATKAKPRKSTREQAMHTWAQAGAQRAQAVVDERRIDEAEYWREHPLYDEEAADRAQQRYEESIGWHRD